MATSDDWRDRPYLIWPTWWDYQAGLTVLWLPEVQQDLAILGQAMLDQPMSEAEAAAAVSSIIAPHCARHGIPIEKVDCHNIADLARYHEQVERHYQVQAARIARDGVRASEPEPELEIDPGAEPEPAGWQQLSLL